MKSYTPESDTDKLRRRNRELFVLSTIAEALNKEVMLEQSLQTALGHIADLFGLHTGWIFLKREDTQDFYLAGAQDLPPALAANACGLMDGDCTCLDSYQNGGLDNRNRVNVITCSRLEDLMDGTNGLRYHASIPLYAHQKPLGVLNVASAESHWWVLSSDDLPLLHTVGDLLSIAVERTRLFAQSTQLGIIEERNRLAREIHDTLAQGLTGIALQLESADAMLEVGTQAQAIRDTIKQALDLTRANLENVRRSVLDLRAAPLEGRNLAEALSTLVDHYRQTMHWQINFSTSGTNHPLPGRLEMGLYRMAQEALNNCAQHARAGQVSMELAVMPQQVRLVIEDNGQGFDSAQIPPGHFGLIGLNERARLLGGSLKIESSPDEGTRVEVVVPLE